jgi:polysaccharide export outer membrane protein
LKKTTLPTYVVEPPDILLIDAVKIIPRPEYVLQVSDVLAIQFPTRRLPPPAELPLPPEKKDQVQFQPTAAQPEPFQRRLEDILAEQGKLLSGTYLIEPDGTIDLQGPYGRVKVIGLTLEEAREIIRQKIRDEVAPAIFEAGGLFVGLVDFRGRQQISGEHLVRPDGTVSFGVLGDVFLAGLSLPEAKTVIEAHLSQFLTSPEVALDVAGYNSKFYYVITDGGGFGEQVFKFPITGNENVLDAVAQINGLPGVASKKRIWVARPSPGEYCCQQILPVQWKAITQGGATATNYQMLPGDRLYVAADPLITLDSYMARAIAPVERIFGVTLLGSGTVQTIRQNASGLFIGNNTGFGGF